MELSQAMEEIVTTLEKSSSKVGLVVTDQSEEGTMIVDTNSGVSSSY